MARAMQVHLGWCMIAIAVIGYFCAFPELAVLLGIFAAALLFVSPAFVAPYLAGRFLVGPGRAKEPAAAAPCSTSELLGERAVLDEDDFPVE